MSHLFQTLKQLISSGGIEGYFATKYAEFAKNTKEAREEYKRLAHSTASMIKKGKLLEIGPGPGYISIEIARLLPEIERIINDTQFRQFEVKEEEINLEIFLRK